MTTEEKLDKLCPKQVEVGPFVRKNVGARATIVDMIYLQGAGHPFTIRSAFNRTLMTVDHVYVRNFRVAPTLDVEYGLIDLPSFLVVENTGPDSVIVEFWGMAGLIVQRNESVRFSPVPGAKIRLRAENSADVVMNVFPR